MKKHLTAVLAGALGALLITSAPAWALKVWTAGEIPTYVQLNSNFAEVANTGLTNANLATNAAIAHTKLATPALVSKAWVTLTAVCGGSPCTVADSSGVTSVTRSGTGVYSVNYAATYTASHLTTIAVHEDDKNCRVTARTTTSTTVTCKTNGTDTVAPAASDTMFSLDMKDS